MPKTSSQKRRDLRDEVREANALVADQNAALARQAQELEELRKQLGVTVSPSPLISETPGRGTPSQRVSAHRPSRGDHSQQESIPEEDEPGTGEEKGATPENSDNDGDEEHDGDEEWANQSERHIMYQLLEGFRSQDVSADDRQALMTSAGGQFADMLSRHWKEQSNPPEWLVSLFRPTATPPTTTPASAAEVAQMSTWIGCRTDESCGTAWLTFNQLFLRGYRWETGRSHRSETGASESLANTYL